MRDETKRITCDELMRWLHHENVTVGTCSLSRLAGNGLCDSSTMCAECLKTSLLVIAESWQADVSVLEPVIHCKDCEYGKAPEIGCIMLDDKSGRAGRNSDGFCAWGVAK